MYSTRICLWTDLVWQWDVIQFDIFMYTEVQCNHIQTEEWSNPFSMHVTQHNIKYYTDNLLNYVYESNITTFAIDSILFGERCSTLVLSFR